VPVDLEAPAAAIRRIAEGGIERRRVASRIERGSADGGRGTSVAAPVVPLKLPLLPMAPARRGGSSGAASGVRAVDSDAALPA
jgi:hypothetical protein